MSATKKTSPKAKTAATTSVRWSDEDRLLIQRLQKKTGIRSLTELLRKALRDAAEKEGL